MTKIGVFDSGVGGLSVANAIQHALPQTDVIFTNDHENVPYGNKPPEQLLELVVPILSMLSEQGCDVIVIACNTVSTTIFEELKKQITTPLLPMEPMVQDAAQQTKSGVIAVCATPTTLSSPRYARLKHEYAAKLTVLEPDCSDWSAMIEENRVDHQHISARIDAACELGADVIVLGCTHYHWIENQIIDLVAGRAEVLQPEEMVIDQLRVMLEL
jgi:glutamate racemase